MHGAIGGTSRAWPGLIVSGVAAFFAKRASTAAREARQITLANTLAEEINLAQKLAAEVANLVDIEKHELARLRCNDLHEHTLIILMRWDANLTKNSKNNLLNAKAQLESLRSVTSKLAAAAAPPSARQLSQMQDSCREDRRDIFVEEHASAMRRNDEAANE